MSDFSLAPELERDCVFIADWSLCRVLLMNDQQYPWFILVPRIAGATEFTDLTSEQQALYWQESMALSELLQTTFHPDKLNIAALGNMVPQLHVHHVVRYQSDIAWPAPVWGAFPARLYLPEEIARIKSLMT